MSPETELRSLVAAVRRRWFRLVALRTIGIAAAAAAVPVLAAVAVDRVMTLSGGWLVLSAVVTLAASLAAAGVVVARMQRRPSDRRVARYIEERTSVMPDQPPADDALVSAVEAMETGSEGQGSFAPFVIASALRRLGSIGPAGIVTPSAVRRAAGQAVGGAAVLIVALGLGAPGLRRAIESAVVRYLPQSIAITVEPGDARVAAGSPLRIRARVRVAGGELANAAPALAVSADGERRSVAMSPASGGFEYAFESIDRSFRYSVVSGSARSAEYAVTALFPPKVRAIELRYEYPDFSGLPPRTDSNGGDVYGPAGTRVRVRVHTDKPSTGGELALAEAAPLSLRPAGERTLEGELMLRRDDAYRVKLVDADGLRATGDTEYFIRVMEDRPPDVRFLRPSSDSQITPLEEVTIEARADDDYGISAFDLVYAVGGGPEHAVRFDRLAGTDIQRVGTKVLAAEDLKVRPGDVITYYARVRDVARGKRSTETKSDIFFLEVTPFNEEFVAAQSQAGGAAATQVDSLIEAQKDIISATWNIERRSQTGRSLDDVKAVAQAQADLKSRAEQMNRGPVRGFGREPAPQRVVDQIGTETRGRAGANPIAAAVEAMGRAALHLQDQKTKDAIPHEMAALNALLQAQAEIRRRQVSQAMAGVGGGGNRQGQDLSALFDKELQRQQRTNYENRSQVEERPEQAAGHDDVADRVRDLARRQEDLSRRQRDLSAARLDAEEMKRQLEKLTREQTELRERAEELARQMSRQGGQQSGRASQSSESRGQSSGGQSGQSSVSQSPEMRDASRDMRSAASELERDDPAAAAKSGDRAAEQLRRLEQQMRGSTPGGSSRAAGEWELEAQQVAQEQQRIASEASRLQQAEGPAAADAARRLAAEKDRLATRVDELQRSARALSSQSRGETGGVAEAARELERQRIGQRMKDSAKQMREAGEGGRPPDAQAEAQLAQALDRVVTGLGGAASAETRQLSEQLNRTREIRDRLNALEQQLRDARGRQAAEAAKSGESPRGRPGTAGKSGESSEVQRLQQEYDRELQRARAALAQLGEGEQRGGTGGTPEQHEFSRSAPGTESFKQDRSAWESLRSNIDAALEKYDASVSDRLARSRAADRFSAGGSERVPERYRQQIAKYYEALAKAKEPKAPR
jgi:hypothetical protein